MNVISNEFGHEKVSCEKSQSHCSSSSFYNLQMCNELPVGKLSTQFCDTDRLELPYLMRRNS